MKKKETEDNVSGHMTSNKKRKSSAECTVEEEEEDDEEADIEDDVESTATLSTSDAKKTKEPKNEQKKARIKKQSCSKAVKSSTVDYQTNRYLFDCTFLLSIIISTKILFVSDIALIKALTESSGSSSKAQKQQHDHELAMQTNTARIAQEAQERMNAFQLAQTKAMLDAILQMQASGT